MPPGAGFCVLIRTCVRRVPRGADDIKPALYSALHCACGGIGRRARLRALSCICGVGVRVSLGASRKACKPGPLQALHGWFANELLTRSSVKPDEASDRLRGVLLHRGDRVAVAVESEGHRAVAEAL